jgi:uncharacterized protein DUF1232
VDSLIDLIPEFIPIIGPVHDIVVAVGPALPAGRYPARCCSPRGEPLD